MNITRAQARTGYFFDFTSNSDKFYRCIVAGRFTVFNWGRNGGPIGQLDIKLHPNESAAQAAADKKWQDKTGPRARDRYERPEQVEFDVDLDKIAPNKMGASKVVHLLLAASRQSPPSQPSAQAATPTYVPEQAEDRLARLTQRALDVIELSVSQPADALAAYADLNEKWARLQEEVERVAAMVQTADSMVTTA
jgi:predicted DNA-binding WGR domain protein